MGTSFWGLALHTTYPRSNHPPSGHESWSRYAGYANCRATRLHMRRSGNSSHRFHVEMATEAHGCSLGPMPEVRLRFTGYARPLPRMRYNSRVKRFRRWLFNGVAATLLLICTVFLGFNTVQFAAHRSEDPFVIPIGPWATAGTFVVVGRLFLAWQPATPYRPAWAGQTNHYGFRYNRYSNGDANISIPLSYLMALYLGSNRCHGYAVRLVAACTGSDARASCPICGYMISGAPPPTDARNAEKRSKKLFNFKLTH